MCYVLSLNALCHNISMLVCVMYYPLMLYVNVSVCYVLSLNALCHNISMLVCVMCYPLMLYVMP